MPSRSCKSLSAGRKLSSASRKSSKRASTSTSSDDSSLASHISLDSIDWNDLLHRACSSKGRKRTRLPGGLVRPDGEVVNISVDCAGKVEASRTSSRLLRNRLLLDDLVPLRILPERHAKEDLHWRFRYHPSKPDKGRERLTRTLEIEAQRGAVRLEETTKKNLRGRTALAKNLDLRPRMSEDKYEIHSSLKGRKCDSGLYDAVESDSELEQAIHDVSRTAFGAKAGVITMPLRKPNPKISKTKPRPQEMQYCQLPKVHTYLANGNAYRSIRTEDYAWYRIPRQSAEFRRSGYFDHQLYRQKLSTNKTGHPDFSFRRLESLQYASYPDRELVLTKEQHHIDSYPSVKKL